MNVEQRVKNIIASRLNIPKEKIYNQSLLGEELGADSLDTVEIIMAMEEEFGREFSDTHIRVTTVQDVIDYVELVVH